MEVQPSAAVLTAMILMLIFSTADSTAVRLMGGEGHCSGTPEVLIEGEWRKVISYIYEYKNAEVMCRELDCGNAVKVTLRSDFTIWKENETVYHISCNGKESSVAQCKLGKHDKNWDIAYNTVICSDSVRLVDGAGLCSGRVEVKTHQSWTTVCETDFDWQDAEVVCRELGCGTPVRLQGALFGEGKYPFGTTEYQCNSTEKHFSTCSNSAREEHTCTNDNAVGLTCSGPDDVRLVDVTSRCAGIVEFSYNGMWRTVELGLISMNEAAVVCRQLDCGSAVAVTVRGFERKYNAVALCRGFEAALRECFVFTNRFNNYSMGVVCSDLLEQPTISLSTPIRVSRGLQGSEVFRGHSFTITCSTQSQYPGGSFQLKLIWNNRSHTQTAVNHSATFCFPAAEDSHQGNYSCVYENQVTIQNIKVYTTHNWNKNVTRNFSSESEQLSLTIIDSPLPSVITRILLVPFLLFTSCLLIFLILKKCGHIFIRNTSGQQGAAVQYENIELVFLQQHVERRSEEELHTDLEQEKEKEQPGN